ncbi:F-box/LRR-repeat protein 6 [Genypterus blacodes]|uniref:F-box/LRR-repeat protein 6 n=1 Tax=Genypterus blacodes TaxID=154954 RepID=UPI003F76FEF4
MDSSEPGLQSPNERTRNPAPSTSEAPGQQKDGAKSKKASLKRKASVVPDAKKKKKKARVKRTPRLGYTVHEGEDMLLLVSNTSQYDNLTWRPKKKGTRKKKVIKGKGKILQTKRKKTVPAKPQVANKAVSNEVDKTPLPQPQLDTDHRWGQNLPEEVLVNIFQMVVVQDGAVPFLCRMARVCRLWNTAASSPALWRRVTVGYCWIEPGKTLLPKTEMRIKDTFNWLAENRFSQLRDFSLCHWKKNVDYAVEVVSQFCPHLRSLKLSYCASVTGNAFQSLGLNSRSLQNINVQHSEFQADGLVAFLESHGGQIKQILFTHGPRNDRLLAAISKGCCPDLEVLEINTKIDSTYSQLPICIQGLQSGCPKLKTFRMLNVIPMHKVMRNGPDSTSGFPLLEELCMATTSLSFMTDKHLRDILFGSTRLRVLDLRGCSRITPSGLVSLPSLELECLFWGQYYNSKVALSSPKKGLHMLTQKWSGTLRELDVTNHLFTEEDLEMAMSFLAQATNVDSLRSLNLSGTRITPTALRLVIGQKTSLNYLNLSSCRYLPRGLKRVYRGQEDICQLLDKLE